jgi:hypothetical protein
MTQAVCDRATVDEIVKTWPAVAREAAEATIAQYGPPNEASASRLIWNNNGPWRRTVVYAEEIDHLFPMPHKDVLEQYVPYRVPVEKFDELAAFDGSVLVNRTGGEMSARCAGEHGNILALNLADEIVRGKKDVPAARAAYAEAMKARQEGRPPEIMQRLMFEVHDGTTDPDSPVM